MTPSKIGQKYIDTESKTPVVMTVLGFYSGMITGKKYLDDQIEIRRNLQKNPEIFLAVGIPQNEIYVQSKEFKASHCHEINQCSCV